MSNLKISTRLMLLIGIGVVGLVGIDRTNTRLRNVYEHHTVPMGQIAEIQARLLRNRLAIAASLVTPDEPTIQRRLAQRVGQVRQRAEGVAAASMQIAQANAELADPPDEGCAAPAAAARAQELA